MKKLMLGLTAVFSMLALAAGEPEAHADRVVEEILAAVAKLKAVDPEVKPMAFWDFDGTIIRGDISTGLQENGVMRHQGMIHAGILAGFSSVYQGETGAASSIATTRGSTRSGASSPGRSSDRCSPA